MLDLMKILAEIRRFLGEMKKTLRFLERESIDFENGDKVGF